MMSTQQFILVAGTNTISNIFRSVNSVEYYNPDSDSWDIIMPMTENKLGVATIGYAGCVYVIGGFQKDNDQGALDTVECYDPRTNR